MLRVPVRSESDAFRLAVASIVVIALAVLVGVLAGAIVGAAVFVAVLLAAGVAYLRSGNPDTRLRRAAQEPHRHGAPRGARHVLIVANEELAGGELREHLLGARGEQMQVDVLAPVLASRLHQGLSDIDQELAQARERLERSLAWVRAQGIDARGEVGDPDPTVALEDELRDFGADEVIVVTHPRERAGWQERGELERLRRELDVPVTHVVLDVQREVVSSGAAGSADASAAH